MREREYEEPRTAVPQPLSRGSADNVITMDRHQQRVVVTNPRPASAQPIAYESRDPRRQAATPAPQPYPSTGSGYMTATAQYTVSMPTSQAAYSSYNSAYGQEMSPAPPPYSDDTKRGNSGSGDGGGSNQPSTTGTQGFGRLYATAGPPNQQQPTGRRGGPK